MKTINFKGKGEHSVNELELIIEQQAEELHLIKSGQKQLILTDVVVLKGTFNCGKERVFGGERCKAQCKDCVVEYQDN